MKVKIFTFFVILVVAFASFAPSTVHAQAYKTSYITSITYQNVGTAATTSIQILFYATPSTTTPITVPLSNLDAGASTSLFVGGVSGVTSPFKGSAYIQSDQPLIATLVQNPQNSTTVLVRPLSNGFTSGGATALIASVLRKTNGANTIFSIQNIDDQTNTIDIKFINTSAVIKYETTQSVAAGASYYVDMGTMSSAGSTFDGSVIATAQRADSSDGMIIGSAMELDITGVGAKAFESFSSGANAVYMSSALCKYVGNQTTTYIVQNASLTNPAAVTVTYNPGGSTATAAIGPGAKAYFPTCNSVASGFIGSAVVTSTGAPIVAVGEASGGGLSTAFLGEISGSAKRALPFVRWAPDAYFTGGTYQRTFLAIQNVGAAFIPANSITITYIDSFGHTGTHTYGSDLGVGAKFNSNATNAGLTWFGYAEPPATGYGGAVVINCSAPDCQLIAIGRVDSYVPATHSTAAEDYNAMAIP
jgi:hypothetical protein